MSGLIAIVLFAISLLFNLWNISHGHINYATFAVAGLLFLAIHVYHPWYPWRHA